MTWQTDLQNALQSGNKDIAFNVLQKAVRSEPNNHIIHYNLGVLAHQLGKKTRALDAFRESVRLTPHFVEGHCAVANRLLEQGKQAAAEASLRQALKLDPQHAGAHGTLGKLKHDSGHYEEALTHLAMAAAREPGEALHFFNMGLCLTSLERHREAANAFEQAFLRKPLGHDVLRQFSHSLTQAGDSVEHLYARLKLRADMHEAQCFGIAMLFWLARQYENSLTAFHDASAMRRLIYSTNSATPMSRVDTYNAGNPSPRYRELVGQYQIMHAQALNKESENTFEGVQSFMIMAPYLRGFFAGKNISSLLDYGGGRGAQYQLGAITADGRRFSGTLEYLGVAQATCFDPGAGDTLSPDAGFDAVIAIDVLEHCDVQDLPWIVESLFKMARKAVFANIGAYPASKTLPNGENAHCTTYPAPWWQSLFAGIAARFPEIDYRVIVSYDSLQRRRDAFTR